MIKFLIRLFSFVLCLGILAGGAYLSYTSSDFEAIGNDWEELMAAPWLPGLEDLWGDKNEGITPDDGTPESGTPESGTPDDNTPAE